MFMKRYSEIENFTGKRVQRKTAFSLADVLQKDSFS